MSPHSSRLPEDIACAVDYERHARLLLTPPLWAYLDGGSGQEITLKANREAFARRALFNRVLVDVSRGDTRVNLLGERLRHPMMLAPVAYQCLVHDEGELATARGAGVTDTPMVLSTLSSQPLESVIASHGGSCWFQLYFQPRREDTMALIARAETAGYRAIVVTADTPVQAVNRQARRLGFKFPAHVRAANLAEFAPMPRVELPADSSIVFQGWMSEAPRWADLEWLIAATQLPVLVKGISHPDDARRVLEIGAAGIIVSNHGGRALDGVPATLDLLPSIRAALGAQATILMDGGIRGGADVFKALALGASAVLIGRLQWQALAVAGTVGVAHLMRLLREELELTMALAGCATIDAIGPQALASDFRLREP